MDRISKALAEYYAEKFSAHGPTSEGVDWGPDARTLLRYAKMSAERPWEPGNNPMTAVREFLKTTDRFEIDRDISNKILIRVAPDGYLRCIKD